MEGFHSGFVTLIGRPNVGKSTLMNRLIGQKIAITSEKPQTTRNRIETVYTDERGQIIFLDTPGMTHAKNKLGDYMIAAAEGTLKEVDLILWLAEPSAYFGEGEAFVREKLKGVKTPVYLVINKIDAAEPEAVKALEKCKIYKSFKFSFHGWMDFHTACFEASKQKLYFNHSGLCMKKNLEKVFGLR